MQPYSVELKNIFDLPMKESNKPGINHICKFLAVSKETLIPNIVRQKYMQLLLTGNCKYIKTCKLHHKTTTTLQVDIINDRLGRFLKPPEVPKMRNLTLINLKLIYHDVRLVHLYTRTTAHYQYDTPVMYNYLHILMRK